jgi:hypothetical protein
MRELCDAYEMQFIVGQVTGYEEKDGRLTGAKVTGSDGVTRVVPLDVLLVFFGLSPKLGPIADWGLDIERKQLKVDTEKFSTSVPGIFAVGDINTYPGKKKLILSGFHECALAAFGAAPDHLPGEGQDPPAVHDHQPEAAQGAGRGVAGLRPRQHAPHLDVGRHPHAFVQFALAALQLHALDDFGARGQFGGDVFLAPAQDEGTHALGQQLGAQRFAVGLYGLAPLARKAAGIAEEAGHQEIKLRPEFAQVVFQRCSRQAQAMAGMQPAQGTRAAAGGVLDPLGFVEDQQVKALALQHLHVTPQQRVGRQHQVVFGHA